MVVQPQVPVGCQIIPLWRNMSGDNFHPKYQIVGYAVVDYVDFQWLGQYRWFMMENSRSGHCYAVRVEKHGGKSVSVFMAREILNLPHGVGFGSGVPDHIDHNTLNNRRNNLRVGTQLQNSWNQVKRGFSQRFKGVKKNVNGVQYSTRIYVNGVRVCFPSVSTDVEGALMRKEAGKILFGEFDYSDNIPENEMPTEERQQELREMVYDKLRQHGILCV